MTTAQVVETLVTVNNNSPIQDYVTRTIILILVMGFFFIYFTITKIKKIVRYTKDFVMQRFIISRFHCIKMSTFKYRHWIELTQIWDSQNVQ